MSGRAGLALALLLTLGLEAAQAQRSIPPSDAPGRERDRFIEKPVEKLMKPRPYVAPPVVTTEPQGKPTRKGKRKRR